MNFILETDRLYLREITPDDAHHAYLLNSDPEVIKYTGDPPFDSVEAAREFLENYSDYRNYGYGRWAVIRKADNEFLGWCGLKFHEHEIDLGFRFFKKYWNNGYATEAAVACIKYGLETLNMKTIVGRAMAENLASINVLKKTGMQYEGNFDFDLHPGVLYRISKK